MKYQVSFISDKTIRPEVRRELEKAMQHGLMERWEEAEMTAEHSTFILHNVNPDLAKEISKMVKKYS